MTPSEICVGNASKPFSFPFLFNLKGVLESILTYAYNLNFEEMPDYDLLKHWFVKLLLDKN